MKMWWFILTVLTTVSSQILLAGNEDFDTFVSSTGKVYSSPEEVSYRRAVFDANKARIEAHNAQDLPFTLGVTQFADLTTDEFDSTLGFRGLLLDDEPMVGTAPEDLLGAWGSGWEAPPMQGWRAFRWRPRPKPSPSAAPVEPVPSEEPSRAPTSGPMPSEEASRAPTTAPMPSKEPSRAPTSAPSRVPSIVPPTPSRTPTRTPMAPTRTPLAPTPTRAPLPSPAASKVPVPAGSVDWVTAGKVAPVVNQGSCGSCYAFAVAASIESMQSIKTGQAPVALSTSQIVDCSSNSGCNGGALTTSFNYVRTAGGLCTWASYPYSPSQGTCKSTCTKAVQITGYTNVAANNQAALEAAVQVNPVVVAVQAAGSAWQLYRSGIMTTSCGTALDHAVLVVGYGVDASGAYWKIKNSWGTSWGEQGYLRIARGGGQNGAAGQCGVQMTPVYPR